MRRRPVTGRRRARPGANSEADWAKRSRGFTSLESLFVLILGRRVGVAIFVGGRGLGPRGGAALPQEPHVADPDGALEVGHELLVVADLEALARLVDHAPDPFETDQLQEDVEVPLTVLHVA